MSNRALVIYHANCMDGFCAAWVFKTFAGIEADYVPATYGSPPPNVTGRHVYILDFSYPREVLLKMKESAASLLVLDHHKTAEADLKDLDFCVFDMNKSGARLTWEYLIKGPMLRPWLVDYTEDRDLWCWKLSNSREINAALRSYSMQFEVWRDLWDAGREQLTVEGAAILRAENQLVDSAVRNAKETVIGGYSVLCVNATNLISEIAGSLAKDRLFGASFFIDRNGQYIYSLRSRDGGLDVSEIAKSYGGGGHRNAAGFKSKVML